MLYHVLKDLSFNAKGYMIRAGAVDALSELSKESLSILLEKNAISPVSLPPFEALPNPWPGRCKRLADGGVTPRNFVDWANEEIAKAVHTKPHLIARWRAEYYLWIMPREQVKRLRPCCK